jgi:hypothetical protein
MFTKLALAAIVGLFATATFAADTKAPTKDTTQDTQKEETDPTNPDSSKPTKTEAKK